MVVHANTKVGHSFMTDNDTVKLVMTDNVAKYLATVLEIRII